MTKVQWSRMRFGCSFFAIGNNRQAQIELHRFSYSFCYFLGQNSQHQTEFITIGMLNFVPILSECFCFKRVLLPFFRTKKSVRTFFVDKNFFLNNVADQQADKNVKHFIRGQKDHRCKPAMNNTKSIFKLVELQWIGKIPTSFLSVLNLYTSIIANFEIPNVIFYSKQFSPKSTLANTYEYSWYKCSN